MVTHKPPTPDIRVATYLPIPDRPRYEAFNSFDCADYRGFC